METWGHEGRRPTGSVSAGTERSALCFPPLSSCYALCHAVRMTEIPQALFCFTQASFSTTKRLHQTKWPLSARIWTNLKPPPRSRPRVSDVYLSYLLLLKLKRVYQSVVCGSRCHVWLLWLQEENKEGALLQSRGVGVNALLRGHVLLSGIPESLSSLPPLLMSPPPHCSNFSRLRRMNGGLYVFMPGQRAERKALTLSQLSPPQTACLVLSCSTFNRNAVSFLAELYLCWRVDSSFKLSWLSNFHF